MKQWLLALCLALLLPPVGRGADSAPAVAIFSRLSGLPRVGGEAELRPRASVTVWPDGRIIWARDQSRGGPPFLSAHIAPQQVQALLDRFAREGVFDARSFQHAQYGPDSYVTTIWLQSGTRHTRLDSWHENYEGRSNLVASSHGIAPLNGRTREDVLRHDTKDYQRFRHTWAELRRAIGALIPKHGEAYSGSPFKPRK